MQKQNGPKQSGIPITRIFLIFFSVTAIIPVLLLGSFLATRFHRDIDVKIDNLLETGRQFSQSAIQNELDKIQATALQAGELAVTEKYRDFLMTGRSKPLEAKLTKLSNSQNVDLVALFDTSGTMLAGTDFDMKTRHPQSFGKLIHTAAKGKSNAAIEELTFGNDHISYMYYVAATPVYLNEDSNKITGILVLGERLNDHFSLRQYSVSLAALRFRIYESKNLARAPFLSNFEPVDFFPAPELKLTGTFKETIGGETYQSIIVPMENAIGDAIGYIVISTSKKTEKDIQSKVLAYSILSLLFGILCLSLIAWWFKRTVVNPLDEIAKASREVAKGNFTFRLTSESAQREIHETIHQFNQMLGELEKNEQLRQNFISSLTHDLRTPLLAEKRVLELFLDYRSDLPKQFSNLTDGLIKSNSHLLDMVNQMLEMYKFEAGKIPIHFGETTLAPIAEQCVAKLGPLANEKGIAIVNTVPESDLPVFNADGTQVERIFTNLIGNAIENIPTGSTITLRARHDDYLQQLILTIEDDGPGIPENMLPHLFERYANSYGTQKKIGSGLGLAICKMIVEAHAGTIEAELTKPHGTRFTIRLPIYPIALQSAPVINSSVGT